MEVEDHQKGGVDLQKEVVDLQVEVNPQLVKDLQEEVEADF